MADLTDESSGFGIPVLGSGFTDILAIVKDSPRETSINATASQITANDILVAKSFRLDVAQKSVGSERFAGEGADTGTLAIGLISIKGSIKMPLIEPSIGWVEPVFAAIWDRARLSWWGSATACVGNLVTGVDINADTLITDNVADFAGLPTPFVANLYADNEHGEQVTVGAVGKSSRALTLATPTQYAHTSSTTISCLPYNSMQGPEKEPAFSLMSLREGMLSPCLINKITLEANAGEAVSVTVDVSALGLYRDRQIDMRSRQQELKTLAATHSGPLRVVNGTAVRLSPASANSGSFGLSSALGDPLFGGYQGLEFPDFVITGISISIDNRLTEVYTAHSIQKNKQKRRVENSYPYALVSEGRIIGGKIRYRSPLEPWQVVERLAGPSALAGGGLIIDFGNFKIVVSEIAWSPSTSDGSASEAQTRELEWTMVAENRNSMPRLEYSNQP